MTYTLKQFHSGMSALQVLVNMRKAEIKKSGNEDALEEFIDNEANLIDEHWALVALEEARDLDSTVLRLRAEGLGPAVDRLWRLGSSKTDTVSVNPILSANPTSSQSSLGGKTAVGFGG